MRLLILLIIISVSAAYPSTWPSSTRTTTYEYDSILTYPCHTDRNCGAMVGNSYCLNGICTCQPGYTAWGLMRCVSQHCY